MLRPLVLLLLWPFRLLVFGYMRLRGLHKALLVDVHIRSDYSEAPLSHGIWSYFKPAKDRFYLISLELAGIVSAIKRRQLKVARLRFTFEHHSLGWAQAWEIRDLIAQIGKLGIETNAYLLSDDRISLFMASACVQVSCPESSTFDLAPFTTESLFVQSLLVKLGIRPQFLSVGEFKSAAEIFTRSGMSPAARKQTEQLLADIEETFFAGLVEKAPALAGKKERRLVSAARAIELGLIGKHCAYTEFTADTGDEKKTRKTDLYAAQKLAARRAFRLFNFKRLQKIALLVAEGNIVETATTRPGTINWPDYESLAETLRSGHYAAVLLRINSPGGSATVSQLLWREWMLATGRLKSAPAATATGEKAETDHAAAAEVKPLPVFVSQGNVAASGGYYLSAAADRIFATPMTITGSIGVVGGKFNVAPLLNKWGVSIDRAPKKNPPPVFSPFADFAGEQKRTIQNNMAEIYEQFLRDVAIGRHTEVAKIRPHASGRVYSGKTAGRIGLTDAEGGLSGALTALRDHIGVREGEAVHVDILPAVRESLFSRSMLPFGLSRLAELADFSRPGIFALDPRFLL